MTCGAIFLAALAPRHEGQSLEQMHVLLVLDERAVLRRVGELSIYIASWCPPTRFGYFGVGGEVGAATLARKFVGAKSFRGGFGTMLLL